MDLKTFQEFTSYFLKPNSFTLEVRDSRCILIENGAYSLTKRTIYKKDDQIIANKEYYVYITLQIATTTINSRKFKRDSRKFAFGPKEKFLFLGKTDDKKQRYIMHKTGAVKCSRNCKCTERRTDVPREGFELSGTIVVGPFPVLSFGFVRHVRQPSGFKRILPPDTIVVEIDFDGHFTFVEQKMVTLLTLKENVENAYSLRCTPFPLTAQIPEDPITPLVIREIKTGRCSFADIQHEEGYIVKRKQSRAPEKPKKRNLRKKTEKKSLKSEPHSELSEELQNENRRSKRIKLEKGKAPAKQISATLDSLSLACHQELKKENNESALSDIDDGVTTEPDSENTGSSQPREPLIVAMSFLKRTRSGKADFRDDNESPIHSQNSSIFSREIFSPLSQAQSQIIIDSSPISRNHTLNTSQEVLLDTQHTTKSESDSFFLTDHVVLIPRVSTESFAEKIKHSVDQNSQL